MQVKIGEGDLNGDGEVLSVTIVENAAGLHDEGLDDVSSGDTISWTDLDCGEVTRMTFESSSLKSVPDLTHFSSLNSVKIEGCNEIEDLKLRVSSSCRGVDLSKCGKLEKIEFYRPNGEFDVVRFDLSGCPSVSEFNYGAGETSHEESNIEFTGNLVAICKPNPNINIKTLITHSPIGVTPFEERYNALQKMQGRPRESDFPNSLYIDVKSEATGKIIPRAEFYGGSCVRGSELVKSPNPDCVYRVTIETDEDLVAFSAIDHSSFPSLVMAEFRLPASPEDINIDGKGSSIRNIKLGKECGNLKRVAISNFSKLEEMEIESCKIGSDGLKVKECPKLEKVTLKGVREEWDEAALADIKEAVLSLDGGARLFSDPSLHAPRADIPGAQPSKASAKGNSSKQSKSCVIL